MNMEYGDRSRFAIVFALDKNYGGPWLYGRMTYWIAGQEVGNFDLGTSLRDALFQMMQIRGDKGQRFCPELLDMDKQEIFALISNALTGVDFQIYQHTGADFMPARFDVRIPVDIFDDWKIFLVEGKDAAKLLWENIESSGVWDVTLKSGEFDLVFERAYVELEKLYEAEIEKSR